MSNLKWITLISFSVFLSAFFAGDVRTYSKRAPAGELNKLARMCFERARYQSTYDKEPTKNSYGFYLLINDFLSVSDSDFSVRFLTPPASLEGNELRGLAHGMIVLKEWDLVGCFGGDPDFSRLLSSFTHAYQYQMKKLFPHLSESDAIALAYLNPWYISHYWPVQGGAQSTFSEIVRSRLGNEVATKISDIWNKFQIGVVFEDEIANKNRKLILSRLKLIESELYRFNGKDPRRLSRVIPTFKIITLSVSAASGGEGGYPYYHGISIGLSEDSNSASNSWVLWHEIGHVYEKQADENSDYLGELFCSEKVNLRPGYGYGSDRFRRLSPLRVFGKYKDFFASQFSPDRFRREDNIELVSFECDKFSSDQKWSESLRQSSYDRSPAEQVADDFAHFVMYPGRFFWKTEMVAPITFSRLSAKIGTDYIDSYPQVFETLPLYGDELRRSAVMKTVWKEYRAENQRSMHKRVQGVFQKMDLQERN